MKLRLLYIVGSLFALAALASGKIAYKTGTYAELHAIVDSEHVVFCMPSLVSTLLRSECQKGSALTEKEVLHIRDSAPAVILKKGDEKPIVEKRGYEDIDAENVWPEWQKARRQLANRAASEPPVPTPPSAHPAGKRH